MACPRGMSVLWQVFLEFEFGAERERGIYVLFQCAALVDSFAGRVVIELFNDLCPKSVVRIAASALSCWIQDLSELFKPLHRSHPFREYS